MWGCGYHTSKKGLRAINMLNGDSWPSRPLCFQYFTLYIRVKKTLLGNRTGPSENNERYQYEGSQSTLKWTSKSTSHCPLWAHPSTPLFLIMIPQSRCTRHLAAAAAATAKSLQSCMTLCNPIDGSPPGSPVPGILQARTLEWVAIVRWVQLCGSLNILWHCLSLGLEWKLTFSSPVATAEFSKFADILSAALSQHHLLGF